MKSKFIKENLCITLALLLFLAISFYDVFFLGKTFKVTTCIAQALPSGPYGQENNKLAFIPVNGTDAPVLEEPIYHFLKLNFRKGILPLWNPHQACGYPLIGMIQIGMFFPLNLILYLFPELYGWDLLIISRFLLAGLFTYWFMRSLRFPKISALGSAVAFMLSGPMVLLQYWTANVDILTPLLLLSLERLIRKANIPHMCFVALCFSLTFFAGHPEHIFLVNVLGFLFFCFRVFSIRPRAKVKTVTSYLLSAYLLGTGLSAIVFFPFLRNFFSEFWHAHPPHVGLDGEPLRTLLTIALPHFFQKVPLTYDFHFAGWWGGYLGTLPLGLAFLSLFNRQRQGLNYFFAFLGLSIIAKSYAIPPINWIGYLPLFSMCRYYIHANHLAALTVAVLVGMGIRAIQLNKKMFTKGLFFSLALFLVTGAHLLYYKNANHVSVSFQASLFCLLILFILQLILFSRDKKLCSAKTISFILVFALSMELFLYIHRERPDRFNSFGKVPYIDYLRQKDEKTRVYGIFGALYPNTATGFQIDDLGMFLGFLPKRFVFYVNSLIIENLFRDDLRPPALRTIPVTLLPEKKPFIDLLNVRYTISPKDLAKTLPAAGLETFPRPIYEKEVSIYENSQAFPRAFILHRVIFEPNEDAVLKKMIEIKPHLNAIAILKHPPDLEMHRRLSMTPVRDSSRAEIIKYSPNEVLIKAYLENDGLLVLSDGYHPDWVAYVDGKKTDIFQTNYLIRSVFLLKGEHAVRFVFRPFSFYLGAIISLLSLTVMLGLLDLYRSRRRKQKNG